MMELETTLARWSHRAAIAFQYVYEGVCIPFLVSRMSFLLVPGSVLLKYFRIVFLVNVADGTGHIIPELDNFSRMLRLQEIPTNNRYILMRKNNPFARAVLMHYGDMFFFATANTFLYNLFLPFLMKTGRHTLDVGTSRLRWQVQPDGRYIVPKPWQTYVWQESKDEQAKYYTAWYRRRYETAAYAPLMPTQPFPEALRGFLGGDFSRLALIHLKTEIGNATALPTNPKTYIPAMRMLIEKGYRLVFVGREEMPHEFSVLPIINYAQSSVASFTHDIFLFSVCELAITGGSGINWLADCMNKPYLYLNYWHLTKTPPSVQCIAVPTVVDTNDGRRLSFMEQVQLYYDMPDTGGETFPQDAYIAHNATADEISRALEELFAIHSSGATDKSSSQEAFMNMACGNDELLRYSRARISQFFLQHHASRFGVSS